MPKKLQVIYLIIIMSVISVSCSKYQKLLKSNDYVLKYNKAVEYYEKKDFYRAVSLFEDLENIFKGSERGEKVYYYLAYCYYNQGDHILAGYYFQNFAYKFPLSSHKEECAFMSAYCAYLNSPDPSLDQTYTYKAIEEMQLFINKYPKSERVPQCNEIIDKLRDKLEIKAFDAAKLYFNIGEYKAAITALKINLEDYPDTRFREDIRYLILRSSYELAINSIESKRLNRFQSTVDEYYALIAEFPESKYLKEAKKIFENSTEKLKN